MSVFVVDKTIQHITAGGPIGKIRIDIAVDSVE